jgi:hypothetical protein
LNLENLFTIFKLGVIRDMRLQFFPWLFDDKGAWEKSFSDPRYSYEAPMDYFMALYQVERAAHPHSSGEVAMPVMPMASLSMPAMPAPTAYAPVEVHSFAAAVPAMAAAAPARKEEAKPEEGILSQDEIDALLSGL